MPKCYVGESIARPCYHRIVHKYSWSLLLSQWTLNRQSDIDTTNSDEMLRYRLIDHPITVWPINIRLPIKRLLINTVSTSEAGKIVQGNDKFIDSKNVYIIPNVITRKYCYSNLIKYKSIYCYTRSRFL